MPDSEEIRSINRRLDSIIQTTNVATGSTTLNNGDHVTFNVTTTSSSGAKNLTQADISLYVGSVAAANDLPYGSGVDVSQWQVVGPSSDWGATDNLNTVHRVYVRNISAGTQTVLVKATSRIIVNSPTLGGS